MTKPALLIAALALLSLSSACGPATPAPQPTQPLTLTATVIKAGPEILHFSGDTFLTSDPIQMAAPGKVLVVWENNAAGEGDLAIWLNNNDEFATDPDYDRILVKNIDDRRAAGQSEISLIAGTYVVDVEIADGPWQIAVQVEP